jgi:transposase
MSEPLKAANPAQSWLRQNEQERPTGLKQADQEGPRPRSLNGPQLKKLEQALKRGPEAAGYASGLWSASRVHTLIEELCRMGYHEAAHVWRTLRTLGWRCQRSIRWALEREEPAIESGRRLSSRGLRKNPRRKKSTSSANR